MKRLSIANEKHWNWKGDSVGYFGLHSWVRRMKGKASFCTKCKKDEGKFQWANTDGKYRRNVDDFISMCVSCHKKHDIEIEPNKVRGRMKIIDFRGEKNYLKGFCKKYRVDYKKTHQRIKRDGWSLEEALLGQ